MNSGHSGPTITSQPYGSLLDGRQVHAWTLCGHGGLTLEVITLGGIVTRLLVPDRSGKFDDVVLGLGSLDAYLAGHPYFGAIIGRVAGRITGAKFNLDNKQYALAQNDNQNHVHGGVAGFHTRLWSATPLTRADGAPSLRLSYVSPDGEEGYPGTVNVSVTYTITPDNGFLIDTDATSDRATPFSLTHHSYFNLAGESAGSIEDHQLQIHSDESVVTDEAMALRGKRVAVKANGNDLNSPRLLRDAIPHLFQQHGDLYLIRKTEAEASERRMVTAARLTHPASGRTLTVNTNEDYVQLYTGVSMPENLYGKSGSPYIKHGGLCLECEGYPDGANTPAMGDIILKPGEPQRRSTCYLFGVQ